MNNEESSLVASNGVIAAEVSVELSSENNGAMQNQAPAAAAISKQSVQDSEEILTATDTNRPSSSHLLYPVVDGAPSESIQEEKSNLDIETGRKSQGNAVHIKEAKLAAIRAERESQLKVIILGGYSKEEKIQQVIQIIFELVKDGDEVGLQMAFNLVSGLNYDFVNSEMFSESILVCAIKHKKKRIAQMLLEYGADPDYQYQTIQIDKKHKYLDIYFTNPRQLAYTHQMYDVVRTMDSLPPKTEKSKTTSSVDEEIKVTNFKARRKPKPVELIEVSDIPSVPLYHRESQPLPEPDVNLPSLEHIKRPVWIQKFPTATEISRVKSQFLPIKLKDFHLLENIRIAQFTKPGLLEARLLTPREHLRKSQTPISSFSQESSASLIARMETISRRTRKFFPVYRQNKAYAMRRSGRITLQKFPTFCL